MKKALYILLPVLLLGCGRNPEAPATVHLEAYTEESEAESDISVEDTAYKYLNAVEIYNDDVIVATYTFANASFGENRDTVVSEMEGIAIRSSIVEGPQAAKAAAEEKRTILKKDKSVSNIHIGGHGTSYTLDYELTRENVIYPKRIYFSAEEVDDTYTLLTSIEIDTEKATDDIMPVMEELSQIWILG